MKNLFLFEIRKVQKKNIFKPIIERNLFFSYFSVDQKYYLLIFDQQEIDRDFLYSFLTIIREVNSQKRKIRSFRGYFIFILKLFSQTKNYEILRTNLKPYFWNEIENVIRQNDRKKLLKFLFGDSSKSTELLNPKLLDRINSLENKIIDLEKKFKSLSDPENQL